MIAVAIHVSQSQRQMLADVAAGRLRGKAPGDGVTASVLIDRHLLKSDKGGYAVTKAGRLLLALLDELKC